MNVRFAEGVNWRLAGKEVDMHASCSRRIESVKDSIAKFTGGSGIGEHGRL